MPWKAREYGEKQPVHKGTGWFAENSKKSKICVTNAGGVINLMPEYLPSLVSAMNKLTSLRALHIALASLAFSALANGSTISVNIGANNAFNVIASTDTAGVVAVTNWNNKYTNVGGSLQLTDDSGTLLATTVSVSSQYSGSIAGEFATPNETLMGSGTDSSGGNMTATVTGITYDLYDVYVYFGSRGATDRFGNYTITPSGTGASAEQSLLGYDIGTFTNVGGFILEDGSGGGSGIGNYMVFKNVSGANLLITADPQNVSTPRAPLNGFQIVAVPEPSSLALIGLSGLLLLRRRRG